MWKLFRRLESREIVEPTTNSKGGSYKQYVEALYALRLLRYAEPMINKSIRKGEREFCVNLPGEYTSNTAHAALDAILLRTSSLGHPMTGRVETLLGRTRLVFEACPPQPKASSQ